MNGVFETPCLKIRFRLLFLRVPFNKAVNVTEVVAGKGQES